MRGRIVTMGYNYGQYSSVNARMEDEALDLLNVLRQHCQVIRDPLTRKRVQQGICNFLESRFKKKKESLPRKEIHWENFKFQIYINLLVSEIQSQKTIIKLSIAYW